MTKQKPWIGIRQKSPPIVERKAANDNAVPEWRLQAAAVRRLRSMPEHGRDFLIAGDMNAARRGPQAMVQAQATGMTPGEPDLRIYLRGGQLRMIEYKTPAGRLSPAQRVRHADLAKLGHHVETVRAADENDCANQTEALIMRWIGA